METQKRDIIYICTKLPKTLIELIIEYSEKYEYTAKFVTNYKTRKIKKVKIEESDSCYDFLFGVQFIRHGAISIWFPNNFEPVKQVTGMALYPWLLTEGYYVLVVEDQRYNYTKNKEALRGMIFACIQIERQCLIYKENKKFKWNKNCNLSIDQIIEKLDT